jgi:hypothetical protein|tara:strand:- start:889 stop:1218 length:330 start_codon:yes stop_codon:yes gene_type:complete
MSKKFTLVKFSVRDGEYEYFDYYSFLTSDAQKMTDGQLVSYFFECKIKKLDKMDNHTYYINKGERTAFVYSKKPINLTEHEILEKFGILFDKPVLIFKKTNNVIQLRKK